MWHSCTFFWNGSKHRGRRAGNGIRWDTSGKVTSVQVKARYLCRYRARRCLVLAVFVKICNPVFTFHFENLFLQLITFTTWLISVLSCGLEDTNRSPIIAVSGHPLYKIKSLQSHDLLLGLLGHFLTSATISQCCKHGAAAPFLLTLPHRLVGTRKGKVRSGVSSHGGY